MFVSVSLGQSAHHHVRVSYRLHLFHQHAASYDPVERDIKLAKTHRSCVLRRAYLVDVVGVDARVETHVEVI